MNIIAKASMIIFTLTPVQCLSENAENDNFKEITL